jgi:hypothetical protein
MINRMKTLNWVTDATGKKIAVLLSIEEWGELIEDLCDGLILDQRKNEPSRPFSEFVAELEAENAAKVDE